MEKKVKKVKKRVIAEESRRRRNEILAFLKVNGPTRPFELEEHFNKKYKLLTINHYLCSLIATGNIKKEKIPGYRVFYKFVKYMI